MVTLPNLLTLGRLLLTPFVVLAIMNGAFSWAICLFFLAGVSDAIDGYLARRLDSSTVTGAYLDPVADKILLSAIYISLGVVGAIPWWMVGAVFARDVLILAMAGYGLLCTTVRKFPPSVWGKISTFLQIAAALTVMGERAGIPAPVHLALWLMVAGTFWSGLDYVWRGIRILRTASG